MLSAWDLGQIQKIVREELRAEADRAADLAAEARIKQQAAETRALELRTENELRNLGAILRPEYDKPAA